jgi:hypothetical protein
MSPDQKMYASEEKHEKYEFGGKIEGQFILHRYDKVYESRLETWACLEHQNNGFL